MQKVVGSSPIIRLTKGPGNRAFLRGGCLALVLHLEGWRGLWQAGRSALEHLSTEGCGGNRERRERGERLLFPLALCFGDVVADIERQRDHGEREDQQWTRTPRRRMTRCFDFEIRYQALDGAIKCASPLYLYVDDLSVREVISDLREEVDRFYKGIRHDAEGYHELELAAETRSPQELGYLADEGVRK